jgi:phosphatidylinositol alpha-mannosyltransferase
MLPGAVRRLDAAIAVSSVAAKVAKENTGVVPVVIAATGWPSTTTNIETGQRSLAWRAIIPGSPSWAVYNEPRKGFHVLTAALPLVREGFPDLEVIVIGHGPAM